MKIDRLKLENAIFEENKAVNFGLYNTINTLSIIKDSENTYKLIQQIGSSEKTINSSISSEMIIDTFIDCIESMYSNSELERGYIEIN